jgi:beta-lactamase regulating signal transducer with metallopeptidase domain
VNLDAFDTLVRVTLAGSAAILAVLIARRALRRRFGALVAYVAWTLVPAAVAAMLLPAPTHPVVALDGLVRVAPLQAASAAVVADALDPRIALFALWLAGALLAAAWFAQQQRRYLRSLGRLHAREGARIVQSDSEFAGPALVGAWRPRIVLPSDFDRRYDARERELILAHERVHFVRGDAWVNAFVVALRSLNWFNPLLHYAAAKFRIDQELACDAAVVARFPEARRQYADAMLKVQLAGQPRQELRLPVGCRWPSDQTLKERILMLKQSRPTRDAHCWFCARRLAWTLRHLCRMGDAGAAATDYVRRESRRRRMGGASGDCRWRQRHVGSSDMQLVAREGQPTEVRYGKDDDRRRVVVTSDRHRQWHRRFESAAVSPRQVGGDAGIARKGGEPAQIKVGSDHGTTSAFDGFDLHVTVKPTPSSALIVPAAAAKHEDAHAFGGADVEAGYRAMKPPVYPPDAIKRRIQGTMYVKVKIGTDGKVLDAKLDHANPESAGVALGDSAVLR